MSRTFGEAALILAGIASRHLGWRPGEFWAATPAELATALIPADATPPLDRDTLKTMLEQDNG